jgi:hypothetical protein
LPSGNKDLRVVGVVVVHLAAPLLQLGLDELPHLLVLVANSVDVILTFFGDFYQS